MRDITRRHLNRYVKATMGATFTARDFRTWTATLVCAAALRRMRRVGPVRRKQTVRRAIAETARVLGNTPSVVRESYVHPAVIEAFTRGRVAACALVRPEVLVERVPRGMHRGERAVVGVPGTGRLSNAGRQFDLNHHVLSSSSVYLADSPGTIAILGRVVKA